MPTKIAASLSKLRLLAECTYLGGIEVVDGAIGKNQQDQVRLLLLPVSVRYATAVSNQTKRDKQQTAHSAIATVWVNIEIERTNHCKRRDELQCRAFGVERTAAVQLLAASPQPQLRKWAYVQLAAAARWQAVPMRGANRVGPDSITWLRQSL
jgi:hypothetical protein